MLLVLFFLTGWRRTPEIDLRYQRSSVITLVFAVYVQVVCICMLWVIRFVVIIIQAGLEELSGVATKPFDFYALATDSKSAIYSDGHG